MCTASLESTEIEVCSPTSPEDESTVTIDQDDADEHEEEQVAYFRLVLVASWYEMCTASFESTEIEVYSPTDPPLSTTVVTQEPLLSVAYMRSSPKKPYRP